MWTRADLKMRAKQAFKNNYGTCVVVGLILSLCTTGIGASSVANNFSNSRSSYSSWSDVGAYGQYDQEAGLFGAIFGIIGLMIALGAALFGILVGNVVIVGANRFFVQNQTERPSAGTLLYGFKSGHYGNIVSTMFLMNIFIILWSLLFIIPGIIKAYEYMMVPYILAENPGMDRREAFAISKRMMMGQKMDTFILELSFFGWFFLSAVTCGLVGVFYVTPYMYATIAELYTVNRIKAYNEGYIR